jgi:hypothetical protein
MSLKEIKKIMQIAGKGYNETLEIVNLAEHTQSVKAVNGTHVRKNGDTCHSNLVSMALWMKRSRWMLNTTLVYSFCTAAVLQKILRKNPYALNLFLVYKWE